MVTYGFIGANIAVFGTKRGKVGSVDGACCESDWPVGAAKIVRSCKKRMPTQSARTTARTTRKREGRDDRWERVVKQGEQALLGDSTALPIIASSDRRFLFPITCISSRAKSQSQILALGVGVHVECIGRRM